MTCWSCRAENDLAERQTCIRCGAPLIQSRSLFQRPIVLGIAGVLVFGWLAALLWAIASQECGR
jgi:uncharacterized paraquat-inducible protein A